MKLVMYLRQVVPEHSFHHFVVVRNRHFFWSYERNHRCNSIIFSHFDRYPY